MEEAKDRSESITPFEYYIIFSHKLFAALDRWFEELGRKAGLSVAEAKVLAFLSGKPTYDTAQWASEQLGMSKALVSKVVESLARRGFLEQVQDERDRRRYHLVLLEAADPTLEIIRDCFHDAGRMITRDIPIEELRAYGDVMIKIIRNLTEGLGMDIPTVPREE